MSRVRFMTAGWCQGRVGGWITLGSVNQGSWQEASRGTAEWVHFLTQAGQCGTVQFSRYFQTANRVSALPQLRQRRKHRRDVLPRTGSRNIRAGVATSKVGLWSRLSLAQAPLVDGGPPTHHQVVSFFFLFFMARAPLAGTWFRDGNFHLDFDSRTRGGRRSCCCFVHICWRTW